MCVARLCTDMYALDTVQWRQTHNKDTDKELITSKTNLGSYSIPTELMSVSHDDGHAITPYPRQQGNLRLTHFQCSQYVWSRNQGRVTSIHAADSVTFAERVRTSKSRSPYVVHRSCEHCSQIQQSVAPSSTCLSQSR